MDVRERVSDQWSVISGQSKTKAKTKAKKFLIETQRTQRENKEKTKRKQKGRVVRCMGAKYMAFVERALKNLGSAGVSPAETE